MPAPRISESQLAELVRKQGYGVHSQIGKRAIGSQLSGPRPKHDLEPAPVDELEGPEVLQIGCAGKVRVRIKFYRHRLADYSRAISEKALIDCLQYAGIIRGDSEKEIWLEDEGQVKVATKAEERTELILEFPEVDYDNLWEKRNRKDGR